MGIYKQINFGSGVAQYTLFESFTNPKVLFSFPWKILSRQAIFWGLFASSQKFAHSFCFSLLASLEKPLLAAISREKLSSLWFLLKKDEYTFTSCRSFPTSSFHQAALRREVQHGLTGWDILSAFLIDTWKCSTSPLSILAVQDLSGAVIILSRFLLKREKFPSFQFGEYIGVLTLIVIPNSISRWSEEKSSGWTLHSRIMFTASMVAIVTSIVEVALQVIKVGWDPLFSIVRFFVKIKSSKASPLFSSPCFPKRCSTRSCRHRLEPSLSSSRSSPADVREQPARLLEEEYSYRQIQQ